MADSASILFVSRWRGTIGPNVWLAQMIDEARRRDVAVHLASPWLDDWTDALAARGVRVHQVEGIAWIPQTPNPLRQARYLLASRRAVRGLVDIARQVSPRVLVLNGLNAPTLPRAGARAGCPVIVVMHGTRLPRPRWAARMFFTVQQPFVTRYLVVAEASKRLLVEHGVPTDKVVVCPNGVDTTVYAPGARAESLARELELDPTRPIIGAITHLTPRKGVHYLVEAVAQLRARHPDVQCLIVGTTTDEEDKRYAQRLRQRIAELGLSRNVHLAGYRTDIPAILNLLEVVVHPSETEACPYSVMQAQACGRAVVGFAVGGMPEMVADGQTGILVPPFDTQALADSIADLLDKPDKRTVMGLAARARALERFDGATNVQRTMDVLMSPARAQGPCDADPREESPSCRA